jgi:hypothetical protein
VRSVTVSSRAVSAAWREGESSLAYLHTFPYLVVANVRERLAVSKQTMHRVQMERFSLNKLYGRG